MMGHKEIETLKSTLTNLVRQGCKIRITPYGVDGTLVGIGFKPYWTNSLDSKIEKLEFDFVDAYGRIRPFSLCNIIGYNIVSDDADRAGSSKDITLEMLVYSPEKQRDEEPYDKIRVSITKA